MNKILVVGATGRVGSQVVDELAQRDVAVKAATRSPETYAHASALVEPVAFDYDDPSTFGAALAGVDRLFLIALPIDPIARERMKPFVERAISAEIKQVVFLSAMGVDADDSIPLRQVELMLAASPVDTTILRPNWFMDNFSHGFIQPSIVGQQLIALPVGDAKTSLIAAADIAAVAALALTEPGHAGKAYTLTGPEALTYADSAEILTRALGTPIQYVSISQDDLRQAMLGMGMSEAQTGMFGGMLEAVAAGYAATVDPTLGQLLGRDPITLDAFVQANLPAWQPVMA